MGFPPEYFRGLIPIRFRMKNVATLQFALLSLFGLGLTLHGSAQADRAYVLCEGAQDFYSGEVLEAPRVGVVDLGAEMLQFETLRVFEGQAYTTDMIVSTDGDLFVSAEDTVYRLDATDGTILASQPVQGARTLFESGDRLYVTRGDYDPETFGSVAFDAFLVALDAEDLSWQADWQAAAGEGPGFASESMCLVGDVLHIGINNAFAYGEEVGLVGRLNLTTGDYEEVDLGANGLNPVHVLPVAGGVVTVNARQYDGTSLSRVEAAGASTTAVVADVTAGCGAAAILGEEVVYQVYGEGDFRKALGATLDASGSWPGNGLNAYSMAVRSNGDVLLGHTDFGTYGELDIRDAEGIQVASVATGIAPGVIRLVSSTSAIADVETASAVEVARYDLLGRPVHGEASGPQVVVLSDGRARMEWKAAD